MMVINGPQLYQWDTGRVVTVVDSEVSHVHFANQGDSKAVKIKLVDSQAKIPDYLLQTGKALHVYGVLNGVTVESWTFPVTKRERPEDYIYEDDQRNYIYVLTENVENATAEALRIAQELTEAMENGELKGDKGDKGDPGDDYVLTEEDKAEMVQTVLDALPATGGGGGVGVDGTTFYPSVSANGVISWTNDGGKENPEPVDIVAAVLDALPASEEVAF